MYQGKYASNNTQTEILEKYQNLISKKFRTIINSFDCLNLDSKKSSPKDYQTQLSIFKYLYLLGEDAQTYIWNNFYFKSGLKDNKLPPKEDFTEDEYLFLLKIRQTFISNKKEVCFHYHENINKEFETERLIIKPFSIMNRLDVINYFSKNISEFLKFNSDYGDQLNYSLYAQMDGMIDDVWKSDNNLKFAIYNKSNNEFIGDIDFAEYSSTEYNFSYFIFSSFRRKGYASEAVKALVDKALKDELYINASTIRVGVYQPEKVHFTKIFGTYHNWNIASKKVLEKVGFTLAIKSDIPKGFHKLDDDEVFLMLKNK